MGVRHLQKLANLFSNNLIASSGGVNILTTAFAIYACWQNVPLKN